MTGFRAKGVALAAVMMVGACASTPELPDMESSIPLVIEDYFDGTTSGTGVFKNSFSGEERHFSVTIEGDWDGKVLTLVEDFYYRDGATETKTWRLTKTGPGRFQGTREDVIGIAEGYQDGNLFRLEYQMRLGKAKVRFHDVLGLRDDVTLVNRAKVSKWSLPVGRVKLTLTKED